MANKFISKDGRASLTTIKRALSGTYDTTELSTEDEDVTPPNPITFQVYCAPVDYAAIRYNDLTQKTEFNDTSSVKELYLPGGVGPDGKTYIPQLGDIVTLDKDWTVLAIKDTFETQSVSCAYLLHIGA